MSKADDIVSQLRTKYAPVAVMLHGSRSVGFERPHSDWDTLLLFTEKPPLSEGREEIAGQDVEWGAVRVPVAEDALFGTIGLVLQFGKVLWEDDSAAGTRLLQQAGAFYRKGVKLSEAEKSGYRQYLTHKVAGMVDDIDTPFLFLRHQYAFFLRAANWWYEMHGEFPKPFYIAMPEIRQRDPEYHDLLLTVSASAANEMKVAASRRIVAKLFA